MICTLCPHVLQQNTARSPLWLCAHFSTHSRIPVPGFGIFWNGISNAGDPLRRVDRCGSTIFPSLMLAQYLCLAPLPMFTLSRRARCDASWVGSHRERKGKEETNGTDEF